jgi:hypothetical protein
MSADSQLANALLKAVENSHVPMEEDGDTVLESVVLSAGDGEDARTQRRTLEGILESVDGAVRQLDVLSL